MCTAEHDIVYAQTLSGHQWDSPIVLCAAYFKETKAEQFGTLLHEMLHSYGFIYHVYDLFYHVNMRRQYFGMPSGTERSSHDISQHLSRDCNPPSPGSAQMDELKPVFLNIRPELLTTNTSPCRNLP